MSEDTWNMKIYLSVTIITCFDMFIILSVTNELKISHDSFEQFGHTCKMYTSSSSLINNAS